MVYGRILLSVGLSLCCVSWGAAQVFIDFEIDEGGNSVAHGTVIDDDFAGQGIAFSFNSHSGGVHNPADYPAIIFDSSSSPLHPDLGSGPGTSLPDLGNVLTVWDRTISGDPYGVGNGGGDIFDGEGGLTMRILNDTPYSEIRIGLLDLDDNGSPFNASDDPYITRWTAGNANFDFVPVAQTGLGQNRTLQEVVISGWLGGEEVRRLDFNFKGSGALAYVALVPEPGTFGLLFGLGALALAFWRRVWH